MAHATLRGPNIQDESAYPDIDWFTPDKERFGRPQVRLPFITKDEAVIPLDYWGVVHASDAFNRAVKEDEAADWDDQYMRMTLYFETDAPAYR